MGNIKKFAFLILVVFLVLGTSVGHTFAYLTDTDISVSRFDVQIPETSEMTEESTESGEPTESSELAEDSEFTEGSEPTESTTESNEPEEDAAESSEPEEATTESEELATNPQGPET